VDGRIRDASTIAAWGLYTSWEKQRRLEAGATG
jgi:hypothetical protein